MMPTPRQQQSSAVSHKPRPVLEIVPDERFIVFHGSEHEASSVTLTGRVRLTTPDSLSIFKPKIRLEGKRKIRFYSMPNYGVNHRGVAEEKRVFWSAEQQLGVGTPHKVKAGVMEWPFSFDLSPAMPESVEGLKETFIAYHLHASVSRPGWNTKDITAQQHIRLVRTLGPDSIGTTRSRVNADIWANKISYSISIPSDSIVFGTSIVADVELSPIKKGLRLGKVELRLIETVVKRIQHAEIPDSRTDTTGTEELEVAKTDMDFPENSRVLYDDETLDNPTMADEMYKFKATLPLPKSLNDCRQDVDSHQLNITHRFKLMVNIHNPEGHVSQLVCRLPVKLFISPNLPVDDDNMVLRVPGQPTDEQLNDTETTLAAPPEYGRHLLDSLYSEIDATGFMSRAGSVPQTPAGFNSQSRRGSGDNLLSLNGLVDAEASSEHHGSAVPHQLRARLANLQASSIDPSMRHSTVTFAHSPTSHSPGPGSIDVPSHLSSSGGVSHHGTPPIVRNTSGYFSVISQPSPQESAEASRRASEDDNSNNNHAAAMLSSSLEVFNLESLSRVPSYGAAIRTSGSATPFTQGPPSYAVATSRPPSPGATHPHHHHPLPHPLARPDQAHVRLPTTGADTPTSDSSQATLTHALDGPSDSTVQFHHHHHDHHHHNHQHPPPLRAANGRPSRHYVTDEEASLHRLRARD